MKVTVKKEVFQKFHPKLRIGLILAEKADNKAKLEESRHLLKEVEEMVHLLFCKETVKTHHFISAWVTLQQELGAKAKHYQTSLEHLLGKVIQKKRVETASVLTNLVNYLSLKHLVPMIVDDFDKLKGDLTFQLARGKEKGKLLKRLKQNDLYYRDEKRVLGAKLDFWKPSGTLPDEKTTKFLIHLEALPPVKDKKLKEIIKELEGLIRTFCKGKTRSFVLDRNKGSVEIN